MFDFFLLFVVMVVAMPVMLVVVIVIKWPLLRRVRDKLLLERSADKAEAFFKASFPELQPHLHPENVAAYISARAGKQFAHGKEWSKPPGFASVALARYDEGPTGELTTLFDAAGKKILEFVLEPKAGALGFVRVGAGEFTVRQDPGQPPRVSYWHPKRKFEWKGRGKWRFFSGVADEAIDTTDRHWSDSSPSSSSGSSSTTAAAAAGMAGLGGTFDGGGASAGWDSDDRGSSAGSGSGSGDSSFDSVSSGSSSTADASGSSGSSSDTSY